MPIRRQTRPAVRPQAIARHAMTSESTDRLLDELVDQVARQDRVFRSSITVDLLIGENRVVHNLGRKPKGATITPTIASAAFAWAMIERDDRIAVIEVVGLDMPDAEVEFF